MQQTIHFIKSWDGVRLAVASSGSGPVLVKSANWLSHIEFDWQSPVWRHWLVGLARNRMLVRYDERGNGLSDHDVDDFSFEAMVRDLETVVDELGLERFPILGLSQGGAIAVTYAARHPERVSHLILVGAYSLGRLARAEDEEERREARMHIEMVRVGWGKDDPGFRRFFAARFIPDGSVELWDAFAELLRRTTSPTSAARLLESWADIDVRETARMVRAPTLVLHARDDMSIPWEQGRLFASLIPGARLVPLSSRNHLLREDEPAWTQLLSEIDSFLST